MIVTKLDNWFKLKDITISAFKFLKLMLSAPALYTAFLYRAMFSAFVLLTCC